MSYTVNRVILVGRLGQDPTIKHTPAGASVVEFSVATSHKPKGEAPEETTWHRIVAFGRVGDVMGKEGVKGSSCYVEGRLQIRKYTDRAGHEKMAVEVIADRAILLTGKKRQEEMRGTTTADDYRRAKGDSEPTAAEKARAIAKKNIRQPSFDDELPEDTPRHEDPPRSGSAFEDPEDDIPF